MKPLKMVLVAASSAALVVSLSARTEAAPLLPGSSTFPTIIGVAGTNPFAGSVLLDSTGPLMDSSVTGDMDATFWAAVYLNVGGTLDFYYQIRNDASSVVDADRETEFDFSGFSTDVFQTFGGFDVFALGDESSNEADRSGGAGGTVGFHFEDVLGVATIDPGEISYVKIISTDAVAYKPGVSNAIDGGVAEVITFAPAAAPIPEPASILLLGSGLVAVARSARRRLKRT